MKTKLFAVFLATCFFVPLASCDSDSVEPNHITFENSADSEIQIMKTLYTEFEPYILLKVREAVSKDIEWEGGEIKCTYKWKTWGKTYTEDMYIKKIEE